MAAARVPVKSERLGLVMIVTALVVIGVTGALWVRGQRDARLAGIEARGVQLTRMLAHMPARSVLSPQGGRGPLDLLVSADGDGSIAYAVAVGPDNRTLVAAGGRAPDAPLPAEPSGWYGERAIPDPRGSGRFLEYHAPVLDGGDLAGHVRVGFREPGHGLSRADLPALASLALPIFLMIPVFHLLLRREVRPLRAASEQLRDAVSEDRVRAVELTASGEVGEFIRNFNRAIEAAGQRLNALEDERTGALTYSKVLSYQKARIEAVLQSMPEGVAVLDESGTTTYANEKLGVMLGLAPDTLVDRKPAEWCRDPRLATLLAGARRGAGNVGGSLEIDSPVTPGNRVAVSVYPLFSPRDGSEVLGTLAVFSDVTAEFLAKQARKELIAQLSHELKTPLNVIGMYSEMMLEPDADAGSLCVEAGNVIHDEVERVTALINNMLSISRIELGSVRLSRARTRLPDLLRDAFDTAERGAREAGLAFRLEIPPELGAVNVDKELLRVALNNLLGNAVKYNRPGGEVVLGAREDDEELQIFVRDTGMGVRPEDRERIFEKFFRADEAESSDRPGHGLGLSLTREIVHLHLGELRVQSEHGKGSEFTIAMRKTMALLKEAV